MQPFGMWVKQHFRNCVTYPRWISLTQIFTSMSSRHILSCASETWPPFWLSSMCSSYLTSSRTFQINMINRHPYLVGGLEHVLFFSILGTIIPIDFHIFQRGLVNHQPDMINRHLYGCNSMGFWHLAAGTVETAIWGRESPMIRSFLTPLIPFNNRCNTDVIQM